MSFLSACVLRFLVLLNLILSVSFANAAPLNPAEIPGNTKWLLHFDVEKSRNWKLMQKWQEQMESKEWYQDKLGEMIEHYGWNPAEDLEGVSMYDSEYARHNGILALHVRNIDVEKIAACFKKMHPEAETETYRNRFISTWTDSSPCRGEHSVSGCLATDSLMLVANDPQKIRSTIDVLDGESAALKETSPLLDSFNQKALLACRAIDVPDQYQSQTRCPVLQRCRSATMFFSVDDNTMQLKYDLEANDEERASKMKGAVTGMRAMMGLRVGENELGKKMLDAVQITREGNHLLEEWQGNTAEFEELAQTMKDKKWRKYDWKKGKKKQKSNSKSKNDLPKKESVEDLDEWIKNFQL